MASIRSIGKTEGAKIEREGDSLIVAGPRGTLTFAIPSKLAVVVDGAVRVELVDKTKKVKALSGAFVSNVKNALVGVVGGWKKTLEITGSGYRAEVSGEDLILTIGYSHPVKIKAPGGITFGVEKNEITVSGIDKQVVGQIAAKIRSKRVPEPYKGKGIKYKDEYVRRKPGKAAKGLGAGQV